MAARVLIWFSLEIFRREGDSNLNFFKPSHSGLLSRHHLQLRNHRLHVVDVAHQLLQRCNLRFAGHTAAQPHPTTLAFDGDAGDGETAVGQDGLLDARNDLGVVQISIRQTAAALATLTSNSSAAITASSNSKWFFMASDPKQDCEPWLISRPTQPLAKASVSGAAGLRRQVQCASAWRHLLSA
jgi:hypothetical protein